MHKVQPLYRNAIHSSEYHKSCLQGFPLHILALYGISYIYSAYMYPIPIFLCHPYIQSSYMHCPIGDGNIDRHTHKEKKKHIH